MVFQIKSPLVLFSVTQVQGTLGALGPLIGMRTQTLGTPLCISTQVFPSPRLSFRMSSSSIATVHGEKELKHHQPQWELREFGRVVCTREEGQPSTVCLHLDVSWQGPLQNCRLLREVHQASGSVRLHHWGSDAAIGLTRE